MSDIVAWLRERSTVFHLAYIGHELREAADEIECLRAELAEAKRDAARYRWLRIRVASLEIMVEADAVSMLVKFIDRPWWPIDSTRTAAFEKVIDAAMKGDK